MSSSHTVRHLDAPAHVVFDVLVDPHSYSEWLVGAQVITDVDDSWPAVGSSFHHRIGAGPLRVPGSTSIASLVAERSLVLRAGMGVLGEAEVTFDVEPDDGGSVLTMDERPSAGIVKLTDRLTGPLVPLLLWGRNEVSLDQFEELVTARSSD